MSGNHNQEVGRAGETAACEYLSKRGYQIVERNFNDIQWGELDIIAIKDKTLIFVEVKSRLSNQYGNPEEAVTKHKLSSLKRTANFYVMKHPYYPTLLRIDVVAVILDHKTLTPLSFDLFIDATT
ncbi:MAG: YraN family protein [candidate division WWE3 bacterium]|nr:YraN family protein [candidate division WWE3 bacterium]